MDNANGDDSWFLCVSVQMYLITICHIWGK